ncbi:MAG: putative sulfate exporter family transporter [Candidatus Acidiferrales bacterium]
MFWKTSSKIIFFVGLILAASGFISPPLALLGGLLYGFTLEHPFVAQSRTSSKYLLQASVVALGFGMNLHQIVRAGRSGFVYTAIGIASTMLLGIFLGQLIAVRRKVSFLITVGTAICGGSAIAAVAPIAHATDEEIAVSLGTVFVLNSVALLLFPPVGYALHMSQSQFGLWAALAIHDTSSVVGAAAKYGNVALAIGTTVKLARALWILPVALFTAYKMKRKTRVQWPWFILFFCLAAFANTYLPQLAPAYPLLSRLGKVGLTVTLYLIGTGLSRATLKQVGTKPLVQGVVLWAVVAVVSLLAIESGLIAI